MAHGEIRPIIGAVDETFLQRLMLVLVDLSSGYLVVEEVARDRTYDTWHGLVQERLKTLGVGVLYLVSDRAKTLIKLAETGLDCLSIPDLFPLMLDLAKSYSLVIFSRLRQAQQSLNPARAHLATCQASHRSRAEVEQARAWVKTSEGEVKRWQDVRSTYRNHLAHLSLVLHRPCFSARTIMAYFVTIERFGSFQLMRG